MSGIVVVEDDVGPAWIDDRISADEAYMQIAEVLAKRSYAKRLKVGALLVKEDIILSDGFNGMPSGMPNKDVELWDVATKELVTNPCVIHAEANVFDKLSKHGKTDGAKGATLYVTISPCWLCCLRGVNNKIARVVYREEYRDPAGIEFLRDRGIVVDKLEKSS